MKTYWLVARDEEDCGTVLCHWHTKPSDNEIICMINTALDTYLDFHMAMTDDVFIKEAEVRKAN